MGVLLLAEIAGGQLMVDATAKALTAAKEIGPVTILVAGESVDAAAEAAARFDGVETVLKADSIAYAHGLAEPLTDLLLSVAEQYEHVVAVSAAVGKSVMPRLAALLDVMVIPDVVGIVDANTFERPIYAGNAIQTVKSSDARKVITVRTAAFTAAGQGGSAVIEDLSGPAGEYRSKWVRDEMDASERPDLTSAKVVVSGGRALGSADGFKLIEDFADSLGAAVGASRAAVDAGYAPNDWQVGQTGKIVAPALYFAIGISGAIQHLAGIKDAGVIVAINSDPEAPIFSVADYGLVGDLFEIVPELQAALKE